MNSKKFVGWKVKKSFIEEQKTVILNVRLLIGDGKLDIVESVVGDSFIKRKIAKGNAFIN